MTAWLLTWVWQGLALTFVLSAALRMLPRLNAATRYCLWWSGLGAIGALGATAAAGATGAAVVSGEQLTPPTHLFVVPAAPDPLIAVSVGVWFAIALVSLVRVLPGIHAVFKLRDRCTPFPRDLEAQLPLWLEAQVRGRRKRRARLMLCEAVRGATVLGFYRPYIVLPPSLLKALNSDELDQIVLHEHAHVQRCDDWTRLAQTLLQSVLWIHPATALIGRRLDLEREMACDHWVVARTGLPRAYARCLARAAEVRGRIGIEPRLGVALFARRRDLVLRVNRLLAVRDRTRRGVSVLTTLAGACALLIVAVQLREIPLVAEFAEVMLPVVRLKPDTTYFMLEAAVVHAEPPSPPTGANRRTDEPTNRRTHEPTNPRTHEPVEPVEPVEPPIPPTPESDELLSLSARSFDGHYKIAEPSRPAPEGYTPWQVAGAVGSEIGASARKTSVGLANVFTRAGVSLARTF